MDRSPLEDTLFTRRRSLFAFLLCAAGSALYAHMLGKSYPVGDWLVWDLIVLWAWCALFVLGCLSTGLSLLDVLNLDQKNLGESGVLGMAGGVTIFALAMYALGTLGAFSAAPAAILMFTMAVLGFKQLGKYLARLSTSALSRTQRSLPANLAVLFGGVCLLAIYLSILTPDALNYDSTWAHVAIAEDYARAGYLAPFDGSYTRNVPHLASLIYTWAYLVPGLEVPLRWMLVLHLEFVMLLWTLVGISAAVRWLTKGEHVPGSWSAFFLFPIVFVYDSSLGGAADHVLAFFAMPLLLTLRLVLKDYAPGPSYLLAVLGGGAALTKYQALYLLIPLLPALAVRWTVLMKRELARRRLAKAKKGYTHIAMLAGMPAIMLGLFLVVFAPHLAKNYYYHENPFYPFLSNVFEHSTPSVPNAAFYVEQIFKDQRWVPPGGVLEKAGHASRLFFMFPFTPHYSFTKGWPLFGPLFTLLLPALLIVRDRRILLVAGTASIAVFLWAYTFNVDRNLQVFAPYLVCVAAALLVRLWRLGVLSRVGVSVLVGIQVVAGADVVFYTAQPSFQSSMRLIASGYEGRASSRYATYRATHRAISEALPENAYVLLHTHHPSLGIDRDNVLDWAGYQGLVSYAHVSTVHDLVEYYRSLGITHVLYVPGEWQAPSRKEEVLFDQFALDYAIQARGFGPYRLLPVPAEAPPQGDGLNIATMWMPGYDDGLYSLEQMDVNEYLPAELRSYPAPKQPARTEHEWVAVVNQADAVLVGASRPLSQQRSSLLRGFQRTTGYAGLFGVYLKRGRTFSGSRPAQGAGRSGAAPGGAHSAPSR